MKQIIRRTEAEQYDGTNGTYIVDTLLRGQMTLVSDNGTTLVMENFESSTYTVTLTQWVTTNQGTYALPVVLSDADFTEYYSILEDVVPDPTLTLAMGYALTPNILASASANVAVDLDTTMSGTSYEVSAVLAGASSLLGSLAITAVSVTDNNTVTVTVQNNGIVALAGATVVVAAAELT